jgi:hypothetical protein
MQRAQVRRVDEDLKEPFILLQIFLQSFLQTALAICALVVGDISAITIIFSMSSFGWLGWSMHNIRMQINVIPVPRVEVESLLKRIAATFEFNQDLNLEQFASIAVRADQLFTVAVNAVKLNLPRNFLNLSLGLSLFSLNFTVIFPSLKLAAVMWLQLILYSCATSISYWFLSIANTQNPKVEDAPLRHLSWQKSLWVPMQSKYTCKILVLVIITGGCSGLAASTMLTDTAAATNAEEANTTAANTTATHTSTKVLSTAGSSTVASCACVVIVALGFLLQITYLRLQLKICRSQFPSEKRDIMTEDTGSDLWDEDQPVKYFWAKVTHLCTTLSIFVLNAIFLPMFQMLVEVAADMSGYNNSICADDISTNCTNFSSANFSSTNFSSTNHDIPKQDKAYQIVAVIVLPICLFLNVRALVLGVWRASDYFELPLMNATADNTRSDIDIDSHVIAVDGDNNKGGVLNKGLVGWQVHYPDPPGGYKDMIARKHDATFTLRTDIVRDWSSTIQSTTTAIDIGSIVHAGFLNLMTPFAFGFRYWPLLKLVEAMGTVLVAVLVTESARAVPLAALTLVGLVATYGASCLGLYSSPVPCRLDLFARFSTSVVLLTALAHEKSGVPHEVAQDTALLAVFGATGLYYLWAFNPVEIVTRLAHTVRLPAATARVGRYGKLYSPLTNHEIGLVQEAEEMSSDGKHSARDVELRFFPDQASARRFWEHDLDLNPYDTFALSAAQLRCIIAYRSAADGFQEWCRFGARFSSQFQNFGTLSLCKCDVIEIGPGICAMTQLREISIRNNKHCQAVPWESICQLTNLVKLDLSLLALSGTSVCIL